VDLEREYIRGTFNPFLLMMGLLIPATLSYGAHSRTDLSDGEIEFFLPRKPHRYFGGPTSWRLWVARSFLEDDGVKSVLALRKALV